MILGVGRYVREHGGWDLLHGAAHAGSIWDSMGSFQRYDAVITSRPTDPKALEIHGRGVPMVAAGIPGRASIPTVLANDTRVGEIAAEYFISLGYQFTAVVLDEQPHSALRHKGLERKLAEHDMAAPLAYCYRPLSRREAARLQRWLRELPKPMAILACTDEIAGPVVQACRSIDLSVPDQVSVLGVNNATFQCEMATPPLSSIDHNLRGVGYAAAEMLASILRGELPPKEPVIIEPVGIVERASTGARAIPDDQTTQALAYIREHAAEGITVEDVLEEMGISRSTLDRGFKRWIGRTAWDEIRRCRIERARELLARTDLDILDVGIRSGFNYRQQFHTAFRVATGLTPRTYRRQARRL